MSLQIIKGNIFTSQCQTLVNTVNCVGVMGAGIALEFRLRYPEMFSRYTDFCQQKTLDIGKLWLYKSPTRWILNFPTKKHWKYPSKLEYLEKGLQKFIDTYVEKEIESIAFPLLGASHGGLPPDVSLELMESYLKACSIPIEIYQYDPTVPDDLFPRIKEKFASLTNQEIIQITNLNKSSIGQIRQAVEKPEVQSLMSFISIKGIGLTSAEKTLKLLSLE